MRGPERGIETRDHQYQERAPVGLSPRLFLLCFGGLAVALDKGVGKGFGQKVPPLRRNDNQSPGHELSVIGRRARGGQYCLHLFRIGTGIAEPLG